MSIETHYCRHCVTDTPHVVVLVRKKNKSTSKFKDFLTGFVTSLAAGAFVAAMNEFERHLICERCGTKEIDDE